MPNSLSTVGNVPVGTSSVIAGSASVPSGAKTPEELDEWLRENRDVNSQHGYYIAGFEDGGNHQHKISFCEGVKHGRESEKITREIFNRIADAHDPRDAEIAALQEAGRSAISALDENAALIRDLMAEVERARVAEKRAVTAYIVTTALGFTYYSGSRSDCAEEMVRSAGITADEIRQHAGEHAQRLVALLPPNDAGLPTRDERAANSSK